MTLEAPTYSPGDVVYLRESAALGFLEAVQISGLVYSNGMWLYSIQAKVGNPQAPATYGDRITAVHGKTIFFTQNELVDVCEALRLAEANAQRNLDRLQAQRASLCPSTE
jgi:hypothetical protein